MPRVAARSNVTLNVTLAGHTPFERAVTRDSTVMTEGAEGDAIQTELQFERSSGRRVREHSDPPR